jgi:hypothetical protein
MVGDRERLPGAVFQHAAQLHVTAAPRFNGETLPQQNPDYVGAGQAP